MLNNLLEKLRDIRSRRLGDQISESVRNQPLMREFWQAEHRTLEQMFSEINDPELNSKINKLADDKYKRMKVPRGQESDYKTLSGGNAMRDVWNYTLGFDEEMAPRYAQLWKQEMEKLGVLKQFNQLYVDSATGKSKFITTNPNKPYF